MKLHNKKTGETRVLCYLHPTLPNGSVLLGLLDDDGETQTYTYGSLAELNEEWEDYKPKEPLIDNEEIREIIRAWAKVNDALVLKYNHDENSLDDIYRNEITFNMRLGLEDGKKYTIAELCGEEEEWPKKSL